MKGFDFMKIQNIVGYLASKAVVDDEGYYVIDEAIYRINDNYTYYYYSTFEEAMERYSAMLEAVMRRVVDNEMIISGILRLERVEYDYYEKSLTASSINENLTYGDTTLYEFEYTASKKKKKKRVNTLFLFFSFLKHINSIIN